MSGRFSAYAEYEATWVEWLGDIPRGWQLNDGKRLFFNRRELSLPEDEQLAASQRYGVVPQALMMSMNDAKVMLALKGTSSFRHLEAGDFVISLRSFEGGIEYSAYSGCVSPAYTVLAARKSIAREYYRYLFKSGPFVAALQSTTDSLRDGKSVTFDQFGAIPLPIPSFKEQTQIAKFLDYETAKIDALIEKQQRLIALLKEKRQAVISHAVTKGLNPDAPMRDSGVEWLGEVPAHWEVCPFRHALQVSNGQVDPRIAPYSAMPLVAPNHIESGTGRLLGLESAEHQGAISGKYEVRAGDVIYSKIRPALRKVTVAPEPCLCSADMYALRPTRGGDPAFFSWLLLSEYFSGIVVLESMRVAMPKVNRETLAPILLPVPDPTEQRGIAEYLITQTSRLDALVDKAIASLDFLQERRTALISAAVTGKIDVRGWKAPESAVEEEVA